MEAITPRQEQYLLLLAERSGISEGVTLASRTFGVSKPTTCRIFKILEQAGLVCSGARGGTQLTEYGKRYIADKQAQARQIALKLRAQGMAWETAQLESWQLVTVMTQETVQILLDGWAAPTAAGRQPDRLYPDLPPGQYQVPCQVRYSCPKQETAQAASTVLLLQNQDESVFLLLPAALDCPLYCKNVPTGDARQIWYQVGERWVGTKVYDGCGYALPETAVTPQRTGTRRLGTARICARTRDARPEQSLRQAELVFFLSEVRQLRLADPG